MEHWKNLDKSLLRIKVEIKTDIEGLVNSGVKLLIQYLVLHFFWKIVEYFFGYVIFRVVTC